MSIKFKVGDLIERVAGGQYKSPYGYRTQILDAREHNYVCYDDDNLCIRHKNGHIDGFVSDYWRLVKPADRRQSGFGKFNRRVKETYGI